MEDDGTHGTQRKVIHYCKQQGPSLTSKDYLLPRRTNPLRAILLTSLTSFSFTTWSVMYRIESSAA